MLIRNGNVQISAKLEEMKGLASEIRNFISTIGGTSHGATVAQGGWISARDKGEEHPYLLR